MANQFSHLHQLQPSGKRFLHPEAFKSGELEKATAHVETFKPRIIPLNQLDTVISTGMKLEKEESDKWISPRLHATLRLYRSEAANDQVWDFVSIAYPEYLLWRWGDDNGTIDKSRITGPIKRQGFARLWWMAELSRNGSDYSPVSKAWRIQEISNWLLEVVAFRNRTSALAYVDLLNRLQATGDQTRALGKAINHALTVTPLDIIAPDTGPNPEHLKKWIHSENKQTIDATGTLPVGPEDGFVNDADINALKDFYSTLI